ncbi:MAG: GAF domain-containing protein [Anaerolineales bacterium]|nr:GAF domain-containing protein [Anaerolineales bacterium]
MSEKTPLQRDDSFIDVFRGHAAVMLLIDPGSGRILDANQAAEKFYGYTIDQFKRLYITDLNQLPPEQVEVERRRALDRRQSYFIFPHKLANGEVHTVEVHSSPIKLNGNEILFTIVQDITERVQAEEALRTSEAELRALFVSMRDSVLIVDRNGTIQDIVPQHVDSAHKSREVSYGLGLRDAFPAAEAEKYLQAVRRVLETKRTTEIEYQLKEQNAISVYEATISPISEDRTLWVVREITERRRMENALRESEERYRSLFDFMMDGIYRSTHEGRFVDVNPAMVKMFGYASREEMLNIDIKKELYFSPEERGSHILDTGMEEIEVYRMRRKDGSEIWVEDHGYYIHDEHGNIQFHAGMLRDVTERIKVEEALHQRLMELEALYKVSASLRTVQIFNEALPQLMDQILLVLGTDSGSVMLHQVESGELRSVYQRGWFKNLQDVPVRVGEGIAGKVFATGQPYVSPEFVKDTLPRSEGVRMIPAGWGGACLPILAGMEKVGVLFVSVKLPRQLNPEQMKLLLSLVEIAGSTLHRTRLYDETARRAREFESLYETSKALSEQTDLKSLLMSITDAAKRLLNASSSGMYLFDTITQDLVLTMDTASYLPAGSRLQLGEGAGGYVAQTRAPLRVSDYSQWEGRSLKYEGAPIRAVLEVPMLYGGELIGVLTVDEVGDSTRTFTEDDERLLTLFASQAAGAIHSARLRDEALQRLKNLQTLYAVDKAVASSLDLRITLNILLSHVVEQLDVDAADVLLLHPYEQTLNFAAGRGFRTHQIESAEVSLDDKYAGRTVLDRRILQINDASQIVDNPPFARLWADEEFSNYICVPLIVKGEVKGVLEVYRRSKFTPTREWLEFLETLASQAAITIDNTQMYDNLQRANMELAIAYEATIEGWSRALDLRDEEISGHTQRVTDLTLALAKAVGIKDSEIQHIRRGALLHDIGKMGISDDILLKKEELNETEMEEMRRHPAIAYQLLFPIQYLRQALDIPHCHHEKWDGTGYPRGLKGEHIPLAARIFAVADVWDSLLSPRPYRPAWTRQQVLDYIKEQSGKHFDPHIVEVFLEVIKTIQ